MYCKCNSNILVRITLRYGCVLVYTAFVRRGFYDAQDFYAFLLFYAFLDFQLCIIKRIFL